MRLEKEWAQIRAGKETEKLSVSGQVIEKGHPGSNRQDSNRDTAVSNSDAVDKTRTVCANTSTMQETNTEMGWKKRF